MPTMMLEGKISSTVLSNGITILETLPKELLLSFLKSKFHHYPLDSNNATNPLEVYIA